MLFVPLVHDGSVFWLSLLFVHYGLNRVRNRLPWRWLVVATKRSRIRTKKNKDLVFGVKSLQRARFTVERTSNVVKSHHRCFLFLFREVGCAVCPGYCCCCFAVLHWFCIPQVAYRGVFCDLILKAGWLSGNVGQILESRSFRMILGSSLFVRPGES